MGFFNRKKDALKKQHDEVGNSLVERVSVDTSEKGEKPTEKKAELSVKRVGTRRYSVKEYQTLVRPLTTEKAVTGGTYLFEVNTHATKIEVRKAFFNVYGIMPTKVNMLNQRGKRVRYGNSAGARKDWKKAIITLKKGEKIDTF